MRRLNILIALAALVALSRPLAAEPVLVLDRGLASGPGSRWEWIEGASLFPDPSRAPPRLC